MEPVAPVQDKDYIKENKKDLYLLIGLSTYLFASTYIFLSSNQF